MSEEIQNKMYDLRDTLEFAKDLDLALAEWWNLWDLLDPEQAKWFAEDHG